MGKLLRPSAILCMLLMFGVAPAAMAQGKGRDKAEKQAEHKNGPQGEKKAKQQSRGKSESKAVRSVDRKPDKADNRGKGRSIDLNDDRSGRDRASSASNKRFSRKFKANEMKPAIRRFAVSKRAPERIAAGAVARGIARGLRDSDVVITPTGDRVRVLNRSGVVLVDLDDERARNLGSWRVRPDDRELRGDAPSFCRTGEGHPVWGRQWCIDKGFGLGGDLRWGITNDVDDIVFRRADSGTLARSVLMDVLGDVVFDRLGLHAITLGYTDPLTGVWLGEETGPRVLRITSGSIPIAEIVDDDRDSRADVLVVALRPW
jgi:hypothetical protein